MLHCFLFTGDRMAKKDIIMLQQKELKRLHVIHKALELTMTQREAVLLVPLSERQVRRTIWRLMEEGGEGIRHKARGKPSNGKLPLKLKDRIIKLYKTTYGDFGPALFT